MKKSKLYNDLLKNDAFGTGLSYEDLASLTDMRICPIAAILTNSIYGRSDTHPYGNDSTYLTYSKPLSIYFPNMNGQSPDAVSIFSPMTNKSVGCNYTWNSRNSELSIQLEAGGKGIRTDSSIIVYVYWVPAM